MQKVMLHDILRKQRTRRRKKVKGIRLKKMMRKTKTRMMLLSPMRILKKPENPE